MAGDSLLVGVLFPVLAISLVSGYDNNKGMEPVEVRGVKGAVGAAGVAEAVKAVKAETDNRINTI